MENRPQKRQGVIPWMLITHRGVKNLYFFVIGHAFNFARKSRKAGNDVKWKYTFFQHKVIYLGRSMSGESTPWTAWPNLYYIKSSRGFCLAGKWETVFWKQKCHWDWTSQWFVLIQHVTLAEKCHCEYFVQKELVLIWVQTQQNIIAFFEYQMENRPQKSQVVIPWMFIAHRGVGNLHFLVNGHALG